MTAAGIVIVGAGQAAAVAALSLREQGYSGPIRMFGRELRRPYERPPLSKAVLTAAELPPLDVIAQEQWERAGIQWAAGSEVVALDARQQQVRLGDGAVVAYDHCLIATGGEARTLPGLPRDAARTHAIRTLDDALRLRAALRPGLELAILGGGFLGLEIAHSALAAGARVTVVEGAVRLLDRFLPAGLSAVVQAELLAAGAQLRLGACVQACAQSADGRLTLHTADGGRLAADALVVAIGLVPNDGLAREAGLALAPGGGILVDAACRTSAPHVFACGDCTSQQRMPQAAPTRLESWQNANEQARTAAAAILGRPLPPPALPWFWTDQGRLNLQILGAPAPGLDYVRHEDGAKALWLGHRQGVPRHAVAINAGAALRALRPLVERGQPLDLTDFSRPGTDLRAWAKRQLAGGLIAA